MGALDGKVTVVIGGGRGVGRAAALLFAREGARVLVNDVGCEVDGTGEDPQVASRVVEEIRAAGGEAVALATDAASPEGADAIVRAALDAFGSLDTLVHTAGFLADQPLLRADPVTVRRVMDVHVLGAFFATRAAALAMQRSGGRIVLTTSAAGLLGNYGQPAYSAAAAGTYGVMRSASIELQRYGVFVNAVAPIAKTRLTAALPMFEHVDTMTADHAAPAYLFFGSDLSGDQTGNVMGIAGGRASLYRLSETTGRFKETDAGVWTGAELRDHFAAMSKP